MPPEKKNLFAIIIQKNWRGYIARRNFKTLLKRHKKKIFIANELLHSEQTYCENLRYVIKEVMGPSKEYITDKEMHGYLFSNI